MDKAPSTHDIRMAAAFAIDVTQQAHMPITKNDLPVTMGRYFAACMIVPSLADNQATKHNLAMARRQHLTDLAAVAIYLLAQEIIDQRTPPEPPVRV